MAGIDTPERRGACDREKALALQAWDVVVDRLEAAQSIALVDVGRGKYFRLVAKVVADGQDLSELLLARGLAVPYEGGARSDPS